MFCSKCGKEISDNAKFCNFCGQTVVKQSNEQQVRSHANERRICVNCNGEGAKRSTGRMIISIIIFLIAISVQFSILGGIFVLASLGIAVIVFLIFDIGILYWGFKKRVCPTCHGSGRITV